MAVGDAGGLVDPITGEGLYYAVRSADLATRVILEDRQPASELAHAYRALVRDDFGEDLAFGSCLSQRIYQGRFLFASVPSRTVQFMRRSPRFLDLMQDLFAGTQPYLGLKRRLLENLNGTMREIVMSFFLQRILPEENRV